MWSNDVTLANKMESSGKPGMVHISEKTYAFLKDQYFVLDGEDVGGKLFTLVRCIPEFIVLLTFVNEKKTN